MDVVIKNIILYDAKRQVSGYLELRCAYGKCDIKLKHNFSELLGGEGKLLLSVVSQGESYAFRVDSLHCGFELIKTLDLDIEVFANLLHKKEGGKPESLASGLINAEGGGSTNARPLHSVPDLDTCVGASTTRPLESPETYSLESVRREVDSVLRTACVVTDGEACACETCPYRDYFFQFPLDKQVGG